ncbi:MAG: hypothetical protein P8172_11320 [Gammaproteobacteria bacterium]
MTDRRTRVERLPGRITPVRAGEGRSIVLFLLFASLLLVCATVALAADGLPLFADDAVLPLVFELDFGDVCRNPESGECTPAAGVIRVTDAGGRLRELDVSYRTRGRWRRETGHCALPALFLEFDDTQTAGTPFAGQHTLPFTTHCQYHRPEYQAWAILEYLAYRYYTLVTEASIRVRLARIEYRDTGSRRRYTRYGFFSEHFRDVGRRIGAEWLDVDKIDVRQTDPTELAALSVFQFMIGHLDWSAAELHNTTAFRRAEGPIVVVPFDFDYAGLVDTEYAVPPRGLGVHDVRQRRYRGFCREGIDWDALFTRFADLHEPVIDLLREQEGLRSKERSRAEHYLEAFFGTMDSEALRRRQIIEACRPLPD